MLVIWTTIIIAEDRDRHVGDHRSDSLPVLDALGADERVVSLEPGIDAPGDGLGEPVHEPGEQQPAQEQEGYRQPTSLSIRRWPLPEGMPLFGEWKSQNVSCRHLVGYATDPSL